MGKKWDTEQKEGGRHEAGVEDLSCWLFSPQALQQVRPQWEVLAGLWTHRVISRRKATLGEGELLECIVSWVGRRRHGATVSS